MAVPTTGSTIEHHPDLVEMRARYEKAGSTPTAQLVEGLSFLTGLYVAISPWVVGFDSATRLTVSNLIVGLAFAVLALGFGSAYERTHLLGWTAPLLGAWVIISQWVIDGASTTGEIIANNVAAGGVAALCGLAVMGLAVMSKRKT
ncbi:SPW repeat protein [Streptomyces spirodelae]|uniref:SPW repeat protein n=1 Tax=Streptomyces spirodelae TaxID=2812904 RepID=A0ABS3WVK1_9ACTN|nr:SPW repeat protein [Streptomyces spirodelae]MBO8187168.1 SPW repeat protein [Streptomyces spirodelae]